MATLLAVAVVAHAQPLVTPVRVGDPDAPLKLTVWAQQDYSHLAALASIADTFKTVFGGLGGGEPRRAARDLGDAGARAAQGEAAAGRGCRAAAGRRVDRQLLAAAVRRRRAPAAAERYWPAEDRADFLPFTIDTLSDRSGNIYGVWHETDCRALFYRKDLVPVPPRDVGRADRHRRAASPRSTASPAISTTPAAGRRRSSITCRCSGRRAASWSMPTAGRSSAQAPHRDHLIRVLAFLRDTVRSRRVAARGAREQRLQAAVRGRDRRRRRDVSRRQLADQGAQRRALAGGVREVGRSRRSRSIAPAPHRPAPADGSGWSFRAIRRSSAPPRSSSSTSKRRTTRRASAKAPAACRCGKSVYRDYPAFREEPFPFFGAMLGSARARPAVPIYNAISRELQIAIGYAIEGTRTPEQAVDDAFRVVSRGGCAPAHQRARDETASICLPGCRRCSRRCSARLRCARAPRGQVRTVAGRRRSRWSRSFCSIRCSSSCASRSPTSARRAGRTATRCRDSESLAGDPQFYGMIGVTLIFVGASVALQLGVGLAAGVAVRRRRTPARGGHAGGARGGGQRVGDSRACSSA